MKARFLPALLGVLTMLPVSAQVDFPGNPTITPKGFKTRQVGGGVNPGATVNPLADANVRHVSHIVLAPSRMWTNTEGKPLDAKLIAFEDLVAEGPQGTTPVMPSPPANPTAILDDKIRLLVNQKPVILALDKLSEPDREFVRQIKAALDRKAVGK